MKTTLYIILTFLLLESIYGQNLNGRYEGAVTRDGSVQLVNFDFYVENGIQKGTYEIPENGSFDVPINEIKLQGDTLNIKFYFGNFFCFVSKYSQQITGISEYWLPKIRLHVKKAPEKEKPYIKEEITFNNKDVKLSGMLYHPREKEGQPVKYVILVHGSGAQDRYSPYYISLGYALSMRGIGVLLYDKRGTGTSSGDFETASMEVLGDDAIAAFNYLKSRTDIGISGIGFLGTSQGGWIAPIAANKIPDCDFIILNAGPSVSVFEQDIHRVKYSMKGDGWNQNAIDSAVSYTTLYFQYMKDDNSKTWNKLEKFAKEIAQREWVDYVNIPENKNDFEWWRINDYDPETTLKNLDCRVLCLFGEYDPLVAPTENEDKMRDYLKLAEIDFKIKVIRGVFHDMRTSQSLNGDKWDWPKVYWQWRIQPEEFINTIVEFINWK